MTSIRQLLPFIVIAAIAVSAETAGRRHAIRFPSSTANFIDAHVDAKLRQANVAPAQIARDTEFLRRVSIDLAGRIPTASEVEAFLSDARPDKRARKIDELLHSEEFADRWTLWFGDLMLNVIDEFGEQYPGRNAWHAWMRQSFREGRPYDAMVREVLVSEGDSAKNGAAHYTVRQLQFNGPRQDSFDNLAAHSTEKFLGVPLFCISCHDGRGHLELVNTYLRGKSRNDFWRMAAFFSRVTAREEREADPLDPKLSISRFIIGSDGGAEYRLDTNSGNKPPRSGDPAIVKPAFLTTGEEPRPGELYRVAYARMLTSDRQFARATVNYLWKEMFGRGLVDPVNAFDLAKLDTQPSHPALLEELTDTFIARQYSVRELLRVIALSNAYQRASAYNGNHPDEALFARRAPRRLMAEVVLDAVATATNVPMSFPAAGMQPVTKAIRLPDPVDTRRRPHSVFLDHFGRGNRIDVVRSSDGSIAQALALMNDPIVTERVKATNHSTVQQTLAATTKPDEIVDRLYLATLSRYPTPAEKRAAVDYLRAGDLSEGAEDLQYALINSLEFFFS